MEANVCVGCVLFAGLVIFLAGFPYLLLSDRLRKEKLRLQIYGSLLWRDQELLDELERENRSTESKDRAS